ncbi:BPSS1780 family membrane protein [Rhodocyclaceae bacterium]
MQARRLPAARGTFWLFEGFRLFRRNPSLITALTLAYLMVVQLLAVLLPGIGPIVLPLVLPILTLIVANGCRLVDEQQVPSKALLLRGISDNGRALLRLGGLQLIGALLLVLLNLALNDGTDPLAQLDSTMATPNMGEAGAPANPEAEAKMLGALFQLLLLAAPMIVAFWFAPFLVGWDRVTPFKSLFFSWVASWRNLGAMGMFSLAALVLAGVLPGFILIAVSQVAGLALNVAFVALRMVLIFLVAPVLTASIYVSYRDIFHPGVDESV